MNNLITISEYFGSKIKTAENDSNAFDLLGRVNDLTSMYEADTGAEMPINPATNSHISGSGNGGFRLRDCPIGAYHSSHKQGMAVDIFDPFDSLDKWITLNPDVLVTFDLFREYPVSTIGWCHLTTRAPLSGRRTFLP